MLNVLFFTELRPSLVCSRVFPKNGSFTPMFPRICFSQGGANVTLLGSADPNQGWIVNDGQKVGKKLLAAGCYLLMRSRTSGGTRYTQVG